jgi:osmotically-inducible protein OsmY
MKTKMQSIGFAFAAIMLAAALLSLPQQARAAALPYGASALPQQENQAGSANVDPAVESRLNKKQYKNVHATVDNGVATLTGTVDLYEYKEDAGKTVLHARGVTGVRNQIQVAGPTISDSALQAKLVEKLEYNRVGFGNVFDAIGVKVQDGAVTLGGHAHDYPNRDSALGLVATTPGVKDLVDNIEVDPLSQMDEQTRFAVAHAIYGYSALQKYAIDPALPIRIAVQNGNVELYGLVDSQADKSIAFMRASAVPGVFSVKNYLAVANQPSETK